MGSYQGCWVATGAVGWTRAQPGVDPGVEPTREPGQEPAPGHGREAAERGWRTTSRRLSVGVGSGPAGQLVDAGRAADVGTGDRLAQRGGFPDRVLGRLRPQRG